jgi:hypothetical protein
VNVNMNMLYLVVRAVPFPARRVYRVFGVGDGVGI